MSRRSHRGFGSHTKTRCRLFTATVIVAASVLITACQTTTIPGLNVRARPATASPVIASIPKSGTSVTIVCFTRGEAVHGDTVWYRISVPYRGYITDYYLRTNSNILATTPRC